MIDTELIFHHLGLAVRKPAEAQRVLSALGYALGEAVFDPAQNVNLIMCRHPGGAPDVEIVYPQAGKSPVDALVARHAAGLVYHVCYATPNVSAALDRLEACGVRALCLVKPVPAVLFGGRSVSFYIVDGMGLVELLEDRGLGRQNLNAFAEPTPVPAA